MDSENYINIRKIAALKTIRDLFFMWVALALIVVAFSGSTKSFWPMGLFALLASVPYFYSDYMNHKKKLLKKHNKQD